MKRFLPVTFAALLAFVVSSPGRGADDLIAKKLEAGKEKFEKEMEKVRGDVKKLFDDQESLARKAKKDNAKLLDEVNDARKAFEEYGILGEKVPNALRKRTEKACSDVEKAYKDAADSYTRSKKDDEKKAVLNELNELKASRFLGVVPPGQQLWRPLLKGNDFATWWSPWYGNDPWVVRKDGALEVTNKRSLTNALMSKEVYDDFAFRVELRCNKEAYCTFLFRRSDTAFYAASVKYELWGPTGTVVRFVNAGGDTTLKKSEAPSVAPNQWVTLEVRAKGNTITTEVDGVKKVQVTDEAEKKITKGGFCIKLEGEDANIQIRKIEIAVFPKSSPP